jgi:hypothetical protein
MMAIIPIEEIERKIYLISGKKAMLDRDLANQCGSGTALCELGGDFNAYSIFPGN